MLDREDTVVTLEPGKRPFAQWRVEAKFWVTADPMLDDVSLRVLPGMTRPIGAENGDIWDDKTGLWDCVGWLSACTGLSLAWQHT